MNSATENTAKSDPQKSSWTVQRAHDSTKNRPKAGNIEKLDQKDSLPGQGHKIDTILKGMCRCCPIRVSPEMPIHPFAIDQIAYDQNC